MALDINVPARRSWAKGEAAILAGVVAIFLALRVVFDVRADLVGDEAYYWMWGQHLGWSYFDHPPLHAWLLAAMSIVGGWHPLAVRALTWVSLAGTLAIFADWSRRLCPQQPRLWFWRTCAVYLASPLFSVMTAVAYNDHLVVVLSLCAIHAFVLFTERYEDARPDRLRWLYLAALALGLATLSKYNGAFVGLGFVAAFLMRPKLRPLLATPHPWIAALLAAVMQLPVLVWNAANGFASFRYHLEDRWDGQSAINLQHPVVFILSTLLLVSPFLVWPLLRSLLAPAASSFEDRLRAVALPVLWASTLGFTLVSVFRDAYAYWNIVAFVGVVPLLTRFLGNPWLRGAHFLYGLAICGLVTWNFSVAPLTGGAFGSNRGSAINFGWSAVAEHVRAAEAAAATDMVGATRYSTTSQLGFALGIADPVKLSPEHSQWDFWQAGLPLAGKSALILADESDDSPAIRWLHQHFAALTVDDSFDVPSAAEPDYHWRLFRGEGYHP